MPEQYREREDKYDVDAVWPMPDLTPVLPAGAHLENATVELSSVYFDTAEHALLDNSVTLRRRTGDADVGWQLKVPAGVARTEIRLPATSVGRAVPGELQDLLFGIRAGAPLVPVATIGTRRETSRIVDGDGAVLAEIADDHVEAVAMGEAATITRWREVEVELGTGDEQLLTAVGRRLIEAGAAEAVGPSKLARVLAPAAPRSATGRDSTLGEPVVAYLQAQYAALMAGDLALRRGQDPIHKTRVASRRYRSVLRVFADLFDTDRAAALDGELAWYAALLGEVRDREVLRKHLDTAVDALPAELVLGPVAAAIDEQLRGEQRAGRQRLARAMRGRRYRALAGELRAWWEQPPLSEAAQGPVADLDSYLGHAEHVFAKRLRRAGRPDARDDVLHRARKAGKRARYTAELAVPVLGKRARRIRDRATAVQDVLGEHQDAIVAAEVLRHMGATAGVRPGENGFTYGLLYAAELRRAAATRMGPDGERLEANRLTAP